MAKEGKFKRTKKQLRKDKVPATPLEWQGSPRSNLIYLSFSHYKIY